MYSTRLVQLLMVALSILIATRASWFHRDVGARQLSLTLADDDSSQADETTSAPSASDSPTPTVSETPTEPSSTSSDEPTSTPDEPTSSETTPTPTPTDDNSSTSSRSSPTPTSNTGPITTPPTSRPTTSVSSTASDDDDDDDTETSDGSQSTTASPVTKTTTVYYTSTDGSGQTHVGSSESLVVSTPGFSGGDGSKHEGVTSTQRSIIIGVTVGVGGAILLAAGGVLYWRFRNKRRNQEENEELISYGAGFGGPGTAEKSEASGASAGARSPFQSTLETYHAPTQTNAASNF